MARTRRWAATLLLPFLLSLSAIGAAPVSAAPVNAVEVNDIANPDAYTCGQPGFIDFEDLPNFYNLSAGAIGGVQFTTTGGYTWLVGDFAAGGYNGKYPSGGYMSKGTHWAWLGVNAGQGRIDFVNGPASVISLLTSVGASPVSLEAYSATDVLLATAGPAGNNYNTGHMAELKITRASADIAYVVVHDSGNYFLVDAICTDAPGVNPPDNTPPTADAGGPYSGDEGSAISITGTASDPDAGDTVTTGWGYAPGAGVDAGATCTFADPSAVSTTVTCTDDGTYSLTLTADDGVNPAVASAPVDLVVANVAPAVTIATPTGGALFAIGAPVALSAPFTDAGTNDTHTCTVNWDDGAGPVGGTVTETAGSGSGTCSSSKTYTAAGVYTITVAVTDDDGDAGTASVMIIVYDPSAGFVTGGGWIDSPAGAYVADPTLTGKANFGFVSKYKKGAAVPTGETEFQFHAGSFKFHSEAYQWLVVAGCKAQYKGTGSVNGETGYGFLLTATDGDKCAAKTTDKFRIKVWRVSTSATVYDNKIASPDDIDTASPQAISGGQIVIHK